MNLENITLILSVAGAVISIVPIIIETRKRYSPKKDKQPHLNQVDLEKMLAEWEKKLYVEVDKISLPSGERDDIKRQLGTIKIAIEEEKGENPTRLEKLINMLKIMSPDIFDLVLQSLINPLSAIQLTSRKVRDSAKIDKQ